MGSKVIRFSWHLIQYWLLFNPYQRKPVVSSIDEKKTLRPIYMISRGQWHPRQNMKHLYSATAARHGSQIIETGQQRHPFSSRYWLNNRRSINCRVTAWFLISRAQIIIAKQRKSFISCVCQSACGHSDTSDSGVETVHVSATLETAADLLISIHNQPYVNWGLMSAPNRPPEPLSGFWRECVCVCRERREEAGGKKSDWWDQNDSLGAYARILSGLRYNFYT